MVEESLDVKGTEGVIQNIGLGYFKLLHSCEIKKWNSLHRSVQHISSKQNPAKANLQGLVFHSQNSNEQMFLLFRENDVFTFCRFRIQEVKLR
jgi:hypothetical protein